MSVRLRPTRRVSLLVLTLCAFAFVPGVEAQPSTTGPIVTVDRTEVAPGEHVMLTIDGFEARSVTISVCGNEARRGSADCNMIASVGLKLDVDGTSTQLRMPIAQPPVGCPCVIRVASRTNDEIAVTPIIIVGHPIEPVVDGPTLDDPLAVSISARAMPEGFVDRVRTNLGGPATYEVTVTVKNRSTVTLSRVAVAGSVGRSEGDDLATLELDDPGEILPGQTWQQVVSAEVPAPSFGSIEWRVAVSGAGPTVAATETTTDRPELLLALAMVLVVDLGLLAIRLAVRRRAVRDALAR